MITNGQAITLGTIQGLTEFLPISSSAHLVLIPWALNWEKNTLAFTVALHIGTVLATAIFFFFDWLMIIASYIGDVRNGRWRGGTQGSLLLKVIVSCIPAAIVGKLFDERIEQYFYNTPANYWMLAVTMATFGLALVLAERFGAQSRDVKEVTYRDALMVGLLQCIALVPGTSRSGITIVAGLIMGLTRPAAARFSFLAALPITFGAVLLKVGELKGTENWQPLIWGIVTSAIVGMIAIKVLLKYVQNRSYIVFAVYRWIAAAGIIALMFHKGFWKL